MADGLDLSIDERDIKAFLVSEAGKSFFIIERKSILDAGESFLEDLAERAVDRALVGVRLLNKPKADIRDLRTLAMSIAREITRTLDTSLFQNPKVSAVREALVLIYERFLLWMRLVRDLPYQMYGSIPDAMQKCMEQIRYLLSIIYSLSDMSTYSASDALPFLDTGSKALTTYYELLDNLERMIPSRARARKVPLAGRVPSRNVLERQGYSASR